MSKQYDNTNKGVLFKNKRKESDRHPDMTGTINIDGTEYWFSGWVKHSDKAGKFISVAIGEEKKPKSESGGGGGSNSGIDESDIPF
jgi:hypothetical protein